MDVSRSELAATALLAAGCLLNGCASIAPASWNRGHILAQPVSALVGRTGPGHVPRAEGTGSEATGGAVLGAVTAGVLYGPAVAALGAGYGPAVAALGAGIGVVLGVPDSSQGLASPARDGIAVPGAYRPPLMPDPSFLEPGARFWMVRWYPGAGDPYGWLAAYAANLNRPPTATCLRVGERFSREGCEVERGPVWPPGWAW